MVDLMDVDGETWVTMREAMRRTGRSRYTIRRWVKHSKVRTREAGGLVGYCLEDLVDTEAQAHQNQAATRRTGEPR